jgi:phosphoribosyl 1,2-cyclic phosphate phosphodiesterase
MSLRVTILGSGSSGGVPRIGNDWGVCDPQNRKNRRLRCSILIERFGSGPRPTRVLIDTSPDMREQLLATAVGELDAVLMTHDHADQTHGLDDLRAVAFRIQARVPVYMDEQTSKHLNKRFGYCFNAPEGSPYPPILEERRLPPPGETLRIEGPGGAVDAIPIYQRHGWTHSLGFRFGDFAYSNDVSDMPEESFAALRGVRTWVLDALRYTPHPSHINVEKALEWIRRISPETAYLTNMHIDLDYERLKSELPAGVAPAFDGLSFETA